MEFLKSLRRGNLLFQNRTIYSIYHHKSYGKVKVSGPFVQTLCIEKDSYMDAILCVNILPRCYNYISQVILC